MLSGIESDVADFMLNLLWFAMAALWQRPRTLKGVLTIDMCAKPNFLATSRGIRSRVVPLLMGIVALTPFPQ
jgi:hypothetical protein